MKTVKGEVLSTTPISLSTAASILFKFVSADSGASQAVCAYLRRASVSFNELNQHHKELKSHRKRKNPKSDTVTEDGEPSRSFISNQHDGEESEWKKHKKKKKKERGWFGNILTSEWEIVEDKVRIKIEESDLGVENEKNEHKKMRGEVGNLEEAKGKVKIEEDGNVGIEDNDRKKHRKNKGENGGKFGYFEEDKKRIKIEEDEDLGMDNGRKKYKTERETSEYQVDDWKENGGRIMVKEEEEKNKKKKKKWKSEGIEEGRETSEYRVDDWKENGGRIMVKEEEEKNKKKKKKRKSEEIEEGRETNSKETRSKKKKKRKSEGES